MRQLVIWVAGAVGGTFIASIAIGIAAVELGGRDAVIIGRDLGVFLIALMTWIAAVVGFAIWFGLAAGTGAATGPLVRALRRAGAKARDADEAISRGLERFVVRPLAIGAGAATTIAEAQRTARTRSGDAFRAAVRAVRDAFAELREHASSFRPTSKVNVRTGVPPPPDVP